MTTKSLIVTIESTDAVKARTDEALEQALSGDIPEEDAPHRLSFETTDQLARVFSPRAIDLIRTIVKHEPGSMREAARLVDRDIKQVSQNLDQLEEHGVIEYIKEGRSKRPVVPWDEIDLKLALREPEDGSTETARA